MKSQFTQKSPTVKYHPRPSSPVYVVISPPELRVQVPEASAILVPRTVEAECLIRRGPCSRSPSLYHCPTRPRHALVTVP